MLKKTTDRFLNIFPHHMRQQIRELYAATSILDFAVAMIQIFEPIYLYTLGYTLQQIILFFLIVYGVYFFIMPLGARVARRVGYEHAIAYSTVVFILYYFIFYNIAFAPFLFVPAALLYAIQKMLYWPAYHADFARFADAGQDAREISFLTVTAAVVGVIAPLASGFILEYWGFGALFTFVSLIFLISNVPLLITKEIFEPGTFEYFSVYKDLFSKERRRSFFAYVGFGEELIVLVVWPVFIATIVVDLLNIGILTALTTLISVIITVYIGKSSDVGDKRSILKFGAIIYSIAWFMRLIVHATVGIFFTDTLSRISKNIVTVPQTALTYEQAKQQNVMHTVVFFEASLVVGKLIAMLIIYGALFILPSFLSGAMIYQSIFVLAGLMSLLYMLQ